VLNKPLDELVGLLGFEIPSGPNVDLAGVKADGLVLHWKPTDERKTTNRYDIQVNGVIVGDVSHSDTSIVISNLRPEQLYIIRVITVNSVDFRAASDAIRVYTKSASSADFFNPPCSSDSPAAAAAVGRPSVTPVKPFADFSPAPPTPPPLVRETSTGPAQPKRSLPGRRPSPAVLGIDTQHASYDQIADDESGESQHALTAKLDEIARDTTDIDRQIQEEDHDAATARAALVKERDDLRSDLKEKEDTSRDLRKQANTLERSNQSAQNKKNAQEKALQQKLNQRKKLTDDASKWAAEMEDMQAETVRLQDTKAALMKDAQAEKAVLQEKQTQELQALRDIDDRNRDVGSRIKQLERDTTNSPSNAESNEHNDSALAAELEQDRLWEARKHSLEEQYVAATQALANARRICFDATHSLNMAKQRHTEFANLAQSAPGFDQPISRANSQHHSRRPPSRPATTSQSNSSTFAPPTTAPSFGNTTTAAPPSFNNLTAGPSFANTVSSVSPSFAAAPAPFFNINNGMFNGPLSFNSMQFSDADVEKLTGGAPMSPGAGADLLPADLLSNADEEPPRSFLAPPFQHSGGDDSDGDTDGRQHSATQMIPGLGALPALGVIPGLGASRALERIEGPTSPGSIDSQSPSLFASPRASASNLAFNSPDNPIDSDRRSIRSSRSARATSGSVMHSGSRFTQILGLDKLNRQRGKTVSEEGPSLGTLSKSQSQSMPRQSEEDIDDPEGSSSLRRNSSHSGNFFGGMLSRATAQNRGAGSDSAPNQKHIATRRRPFNMFPTRTDGWAAFMGGDNNRPSSPRPGSTHSTELPRPSGESSTWGFWPSSVEVFGQRSSPLSADWVTPQSNLPMSNSQPWGSRHPSRRPSIQHGNSGNGVSDYILEDDTDHSDAGASVPLPPIGTRPAQAPPRVPSPKLNPAAKDFKSLFSGKRSKKDDGDKKKDQDKSNEDASTTPVASSSVAPRENVSMGSPEIRGGDERDWSPAMSRKSRDAHSIMTADSSINGYSARNSLDHSVSHTPSEALTPSSLSGSVNNKESFMAKLTRKSSSGKFGLPVFSRDKKTRMQRGSLIDEDEDALTHSLDSIATTNNSNDDKKSGRGSTRSWSSMFGGGKMGKGKDRGDKTPSVSEASAASETGGDESD